MQHLLRLLGHRGQYAKEKIAANVEQLLLGQEGAVRQHWKPRYVWLSFSTDDLVSADKSKAVICSLGQIA